ncbi:hypothetical protein, conserved [Trypanosoma brucei gambiense DAL972]|uniref:Prefoldin subunit n=1 Tax=Trypanosoma brucei gambiense (strain MHOM/CI/86/DAL972) TaxID=679716 RepID=D0A9G6_TRYB9|nr:hypothetical protein, conserved [Trypanosoma brucei gambiense DAL972]CBH18317.1 hypothetical protein, conserved [Trypanosoma brucei gambiense DAL972]|eukprot:XP_011780581.1 hypothetical protein, conserved [Trypanosoma brucei gambiense DAL972]
MSGVSRGESDPSHAPADAAMGSMLRLEHFLDAVLRQSLARVLAQRDEVYNMASNCCQLRSLFDEMQSLSSTHSFIRRDEGSSTALTVSAAVAAGEGKQSVGNATVVRGAGSTPGDVSVQQRNHIMVDLGNHFFVQCTVADASRMWVNLGCGVVLPMFRDEALAFLQRRERLLRERAARLSKEALRIKYRMRLVMEAITRLYDRTTGRKATWKG